MNGYQVTDELWTRIEPLIPKRANNHPRGGGRKRVDDRKVFDAIVIGSGKSFRSRPMPLFLRFVMCCLSKCLIGRSPMN